MNRVMKIKILVSAAVILCGVGCQPQAPINHSEDFAPDDQPTAMGRILDAQVARGAREDATLDLVHFDGENLNSLGMAKLNLMLKDDSSLPLSIWMNVPDDDRVRERRSSVATYLKDKGLASDQIHFGVGANPDTAHPAVLGLRDLAKTDGESGGGTPDAGAGAAPGASH